MQLDTFKKKNLRFIYNGYTKWYERLRSFFLWTYYLTLGQRVLQLSCVNWRINFLLLAEWILESKVLRESKTKYHSRISLPLKDARVVSKFKMGYDSRHSL